MKTRMLFNLLLVAVLVLAVGGVTAQATVGGPICNVPADYATITAAVADPGCSTINVAAGTYNEQVQITRTLTLKGAQAGVDARTRSGPESIINNACGPVQIMADNVTLDGFTIQGSTLPDPCFLAGIWDNPGFSGTHGGSQILNNIVQNNINGIDAGNDGTLPALIQFNLIQNNNNPGPNSGVGIATDFGFQNVVVDSNKFNGDQALFTFASSFTFSNNEIANVPASGAYLLSVSNVSVSGNTVHDNLRGIRLGGGNAQITISGNTIMNNTNQGILVLDDGYSLGFNSQVVANNNCIVGNAVAGLEEDTGGYTGTLDATNNWWGSATGPTIASNPGGTGDKIVDSDGVVLYTPFLTSPPARCAPPPISTWRGDLYIAIVGDDFLTADPFYFSPKYRQFMFDQSSTGIANVPPVCFGTFPPISQYTRVGDAGCEQFRSQTLNNQPEVCDATTQALGLKNAKTPAGNSGFYEWWIRVPEKPAGEINIVIQCGVLKPGAFAAYGNLAIDLCAAETGEWIGAGLCVRQEVDPGVSPVNQLALPRITAIAYPGAYNVAFAPFHLTAFKNPSGYSSFFDKFGNLVNTTSTQILDGSTNARVLLKACMDKTIVTKLPVSGQVNALGDTENDLVAGDIIYVRMDVPRQNTVDVYCHAQSARVMGVGEAP